MLQELTLEGASIVREPAVLDSDAISGMLSAAANRGVFPGAVWAVGDADGQIDQGEIGVLDPDFPQQRMSHDVIFDLSSLTKIIAVWSLIGHLQDAGKLGLNDRLEDHLAESRGHELGTVTLRQLLTHTAGLPLRSRLRELYGADPGKIRRGVLAEGLRRTPGEAVDYTDRASLILGYVAEQITCLPLDRAATELIWQPLGMKETMFGPLPSALVGRCAPTEFDESSGAHLRGVVHDFSARLLGGVCGVSGAFAPIADLAAFMRQMLAPRDSVFSAAWIKTSLTVQTGALTPQRGLFWLPPQGTDPRVDDVWLHYGFTGTGLWLSPRRGRWAALLTNKLYFSRDREPLADVRNAFRSLVFA